MRPCCPGKDTHGTASFARHCTNCTKTRLERSTLRQASADCCVASPYNNTQVQCTTKKQKKKNNERKKKQITKQKKIPPESEESALFGFFRGFLRGFFLFSFLSCKNAHSFIFFLFCVFCKFVCLFNCKHFFLVFFSTYFIHVLYQIFEVRS